MAPPDAEELARFTAKQLAKKMYRKLTKVQIQAMGWHRKGFLSTRRPCSSTYLPMA